MRSISCLFPSAPVTLLSAMAVGWLAFLPAAGAFELPVSGGTTLNAVHPGANTALPDDGPATNPFVSVTHFRMALTARTTSGLFSARATTGAAGPTEFADVAAALTFASGVIKPATGNPVLRADDTAVPIDQNNATADVSSLAIDNAPAIDGPEQSAFKDISLHAPVFPGIAALCAIGLGLAYGASNDARQEKKRRGKERQRTRGFRRMAPPIYTREKPMRVRLTIAPGRDAEK